jgi:hypothetical protein
MGVSLNACGTSVFFFFFLGVGGGGEQIFWLILFFSPKIWQNLGNFGFESKQCNFLFLICADFLGKKTHQFLNITKLGEKIKF